MGLLSHSYFLPKFHLLEVFGYIYLFAFLSVYLLLLLLYVCMYIYVQTTGLVGGVVPLIPPCVFSVVRLGKCLYPGQAWTIFAGLYSIDFMYSYYKDQLKTECVCVKLGSVIY